MVTASVKYEKWSVMMMTNQLPFSTCSSGPRYFMVNKSGLYAGKLFKAACMVVELGAGCNKDSPFTNAICIICFVGSIQFVFYRVVYVSITCFSNESWIMLQNSPFDCNVGCMTFCRALSIAIIRVKYHNMSSIDYRRRRMLEPTFLNYQVNIDEHCCRTALQGAGLMPFLIRYEKLGNLQCFLGPEL